MEKLDFKNLMGKYDNSSLQFINHGMGLMREEEHTHLVKNGFITCYSGNGRSDAVRCDSFCVNIYKDEEPRCVFEGNYRECQFEAEKLRADNKIKKVKVCGVPKGFTEFYKLNEKRNYEEESQEQELVDLITF